MLDTSKQVHVDVVTNVQVQFLKDPDGGPVKAEHMRVVRTSFTIPSTASLPAGTLILKNLFLSLDPYMRGRMNTKSKESYMPPFVPGEVIATAGVAEVVAGKREGIEVGDVVTGLIGLETYTTVPPAARLARIDRDSELPLSYYIGVLGMPGATAYYGLSLGDPKAGQTIFISGAAGAVGQLVGQLAKAKGLRVIGSAGSDEKVELLKSTFGYDASFNYKKVQGAIQPALEGLAPDGIDIYFDNVGSEHLDAALGCLKHGGCVVACGMISNYNGETYAFQNMPSIVFKEIQIRGFLIGQKVRDAAFMKELRSELGQLLKDGKIKAVEDIVEGVENAHEAFVGLFSGKNVGKLVIKV